MGLFGNINNSLLQTAIQRLRAKKAINAQPPPPIITHQSGNAVRQQQVQNANKNNTNMNQLQSTPINPNATSNMQTLQAINGTQIPNTFDMSMEAPVLGMDPSAQQVIPNVPVANPQNVQTQIMPNNNIQTY